MKFMESLHRGGMLFDGGFGAMLIRLGVAAPECSEMMNLENPDIIKSVHRAFVDGGSKVIETNTFGANPIYLRKYGLEGKCGEITAAGVKIAKEAAGSDAFVALSIGPSGGMLKPMGELSATEMMNCYFIQAKAGIEAGADAVIIETMGDISEARLAAIGALRARENADIAIISSFTFEGERMMTGGTPESAALIMEAVGVDAIGVNCSGGPEQLLNVLKRMRNVTALPIIVQPNAGIPRMENGKTLFPLSPEDMAPKMGEIVGAGAQAIGGCCGTTPDHIAMMKPYADKIGAFLPAAKKIKAAVTQRAVFPLEEIDLEKGQSLPAAMDDLYDADPDAAFVSLDLSGLSQSEIEELLLEGQQMIKTPLCIDCDNDEMLDFALSIYGGVALTHGKSSYGAVRI